MRKNDFYSNFSYGSHALIILRTDSILTTGKTTKYGNRSERWTEADILRICFGAQNTREKHHRHNLFLQNNDIRRLEKSVYVLLGNF